MGLAGGAQLEQVVALAQAEAGQDALQMGVGCQILGEGRGMVMESLESPFRHGNGVVEDALHTGIPD